MKQYIDKDALVAEIEKRLNYRNKELDAINNGTFWDEEQSEDTFNVALTKCAYNAVKNELFELKCFLDIVEVKEVDLEKDVRQIISLYYERIKYYEDVIRKEREENGSSDLAIKILDGVVDARELCIQYVIDKLKAQKGE